MADGQTKAKRKGKKSELQGWAQGAWMYALGWELAHTCRLI